MDLGVDDVSAYDLTNAEKDEAEMSSVAGGSSSASVAPTTTSTGSSSLEAMLMTVLKALMVDVSEALRTLNKILVLTIAFSVQSPQFLLEQMMEGLKHALLCNKEDLTEKLTAQKVIRNTLTNDRDITDVSAANMLVLGDRKNKDKTVRDLAIEFTDLEEEIANLKKSIGYKEEAIKILTPRIEKNKHKFIEGTSLADLAAARQASGNPQKFSPEKLRILHYMGLTDRAGNKLGGKAAAGGKAAGHAEVEDEEEQHTAGSKRTRAASGK